MEAKHWKHLIVGTAAIAGFFVGVWAFNNNVVPAWGAIIACGLIVVLSINYIINQIKSN